MIRRTQSIRDLRRFPGEPGPERGSAIAWLRYGTSMRAATDHTTLLAAIVTGLLGRSVVVVRARFQLRTRSSFQEQVAAVVRIRVFHAHLGHLADHLSTPAMPKTRSSDRCSFCGYHFGDDVFDRCPECGSYSSCRVVDKQLLLFIAITGSVLIAITVLLSGSTGYPTLWSPMPLVTTLSRAYPRTSRSNKIEHAK